MIQNRPIRKKYYFSASDVNERITTFHNYFHSNIDQPSDGIWEKSNKDLMGIFNLMTLRIKSGYKLESYVKLGREYLTYVFALPENINCPVPKRRKNIGFEEVMPKNAILNFMDVIEGDMNNPWSYLEASIFKREISSHNSSWHRLEILSQHPSNSNTEIAKWDYLISPSDWRPLVYFKDGSVYVQFYTTTSLWEESISRDLDIYWGWNSYAFRTESAPIAFGGVGSIII